MVKPDIGLQDCGHQARQRRLGKIRLGDVGSIVQRHVLAKAAGCCHTASLVDIFSAAARGFCDGAA